MPTKKVKMNPKVKKGYTAHMVSSKAPRYDITDSATSAKKPAIKKSK